VLRRYCLLPALVLGYHLSALAETCSYQSYQWNTLRQQAENFVRVRKSYADLDASEIDVATGCTVCEEDQSWIEIAGLEPVRVCKSLAVRVREILVDAVAGGFEIRTLVGYRVGKTRGEVDGGGRRTGFSNHSFGIAIDINIESNGLYANCLEFGPQCRLLRGGHWRPATDPLSITADSRLVRSMKSAGFHWGGEISGRQKDFMHFSPSGY